MKIAVQGSKDFSDYTIFLRAMRTALYSMGSEDKTVEVYTFGPIRVNQMAEEFCNVSEAGFRGRGMRIVCRMLPRTWLSDNMHKMDYFAFFKKPGEPTSKMVDLADELGIDAQIYEFK